MGEGIHRTKIDEVVEAFIVYDPNLGKERRKSYSEFVTDFSSGETSISQKFESLRIMFKDFHPETKPILWRVLILQAHLYQAFRTASDSNRPDSVHKKKLTVTNFSFPKQYSFYWLWVKEESKEQERMREPFKVAEQYLKNRLFDGMYIQGDTV
ncbi:hypothetical protein [Candidatus Chlorohelix sp.]|uniref:hypothetical protein n=1 Tax=Candidatus Chlorohelix sp. TaxID=3139201 RepID=UPI003037C283